MTADRNAQINFADEDDEFWERWKLNIFEPRVVKPMKKPLTESLDLAVSESDLEKLKAGFRSRNLDDKWSWLIEDNNGEISIHIVRHFVHEEVYILRIAPKSSNENGASAKIHSLTWDGDVPGMQKDAEQVMKYLVLLARHDLRCDFETLPHYAPGTV
jgi:hypothetical protein